MTHGHHDHPARWPAWLIVAVGGISTVVALIWAGATYDTHGNALIDEPISTVLVALIGAAATIGAAFGARVLSKIRHQVENSHGTNLRDDIDDSRKDHAAATERILGELRDVRLAVGRLADTDHATHEDLSQLRKEFARHTAWSQQYTESQEQRLNRLEGKQP